MFNNVLSAPVQWQMRDGADIHLRRRDGRTAHTIATLCGEQEMAAWLADWLLRWLVPATDQEEIRGDLVEEFSLRAQSSDSCWSWYWGQILGSLPPMALKAARQGRWLRTFLVALGTGSMRP